MRHRRCRNPCQELRVHGTVPSRPTWPAQKAEMSTIPRTYHLNMGRQGDIIKHVGINQGIISREEDVTGDGQARGTRGAALHWL
jgi:hypothetical protein